MFLAGAHIKMRKGGVMDYDLQPSPGSYSCRIWAAIFEMTERNTPFSYRCPCWMDVVAAEAIGRLRA